MSLYKRGSTWWIGFTTPGGERIRRSACTEIKAEAQELHDQLKAQAWRVAQLGERQRRTWDEAAYRWLLETEHKKSHLQDVKQVQWVQQFFRGRYLDELTRDVITDVVEPKRREFSASTANRYLAMIRAILRRAAFEWEWIDKAPVFRLYKEPKRRVRFLLPEQARMLIQELPEHLGDVVLFSLATGLRKSNATRLEWSQVDLERRSAWIHADQAKGGKSIPVALNDTAMAALTKQIGNHKQFVFTYRSKPIEQVSTKAWRNALQRAGIEDFRWHDLRHTWASWLTQSGVPLNVIQEMGAWQSTEMVRRYAHLAPEQLRTHASAVDVMLSGTTATQPQEKLAGSVASI